MTSEESAFIRKSAENYAKLAEAHAAEWSQNDEELASELGERAMALEANDGDGSFKAVPA